MNRNLLLAFLLLISPFFLKAQIDESKPFKVTKAYAYVKTAPLSIYFWISNQARGPAEFKHISKRRKRN